MSRLGPFEENTIITGDAKELSLMLPDESIDIIFTDPPYPKKYLPLYEWLAETALRILKRGGLCLAMAGQSYLPQIYQMMGQYLEYHWTFLLQTPGQKCTVWPRKVSPGWKPVLSHSKGRYEGPWWGVDVMTSKMPDKRYHPWGQSESGVMAFVARLPSGVILDPFCGGGTIPAVCKMLSRPYLAFEISSEVARSARDRLENTQAALFQIRPQQADLFEAGGR